MEIKIEIIKIISEIKAIFKNEVKKIKKKIPQNIIKSFLRDIAFFIKARLPQIYRFIPAQHLTLILKTIFWVILFGFLVYNFLPLPYFQSFVINNKPEEHIRLGERYLEKNNPEKAEEEYLLAKESYDLRFTNYDLRAIKGINNKISYIQNLIKKPKELENETTRWEEILRVKANYRDAYLELAILHFQLKRPLMAKEYLGKAIELDPNFKLTNDLKEILQKK